VRADCPPNGDCGPYGECLKDTLSCGNNCTERCKCEPNYFGPDCSYQAEVCPNSILGATDDEAEVCFNGGTCYPVTQLAGSSAEVYYQCDCRKAYGDAGKIVYAGHQCEYPAQASCESGVASSLYAFCVNGGTCKATVPPGSPHPGCTCPVGFDGRHCQYAYGTAPAKELEYSPPDSANAGNPLSPAAIFFLVLFATAFVVGVAVFAWRRQRQRDLAHEVEQNLSSMGAPADNGRQSLPTPSPGHAPHDLYLHDDADEVNEVSSSPGWTRSAGGGGDDDDDDSSLQPPDREII
jgi:hypothetical protein